MSAERRWRICLCGDDSLAHALAAVLGARDEIEVRILSEQSHRWAERVHAFYLDIAEVVGRPALVTDHAGEAVPGADYVILTGPASQHRRQLGRVGPALSDGTWVGAFPGYGGFDWTARQVLGAEAKIFGLQRVPYVRRIISFGEAVWISGIRPTLYVASLPSTAVAAVARDLQSMLNIPTIALPNYIAVSLSHSNPIFHPARLYSLFKDWAPGTFYDHRPQFYEDWDDRASDLYLGCDAEIQSLCDALPCDLSGVQPLLLHYGLDRSEKLTQRIRTIRALRDRAAPMVLTKDGYLPDLFSSYFREDIAFGLLVVRAIAELADVATPTMDLILNWAQSIQGMQYLRDNRLQLPGLTGLPLPQNFGIRTISDLISRAQA
ncbi:MAG: NAD/NADP octopine/nopaline dehydrogenase family protein [Kiloniellales bacterium]